MHFFINFHVFVAIIKTNQKFLTKDHFYFNDLEKNSVRIWYPFILSDSEFVEKKNVQFWKIIEKPSLWNRNFGKIQKKLHLTQLFCKISLRAPCKVIFQQLFDQASQKEKNLSRIIVSFAYNSKTAISIDQNRQYKRFV